MKINLFSNGDQTRSGTQDKDCFYFIVSATILRNVLLTFSLSTSSQFSYISVDWLLENLIQTKVCKLDQVSRKTTSYTSDYVINKYAG